MKKTLLLFGQLFWAFIVLQAQPSFLALTEQGARFGTISKYDIATNTISVAHAIETKGAFSSSNMLKAVDGKFYGTTRDGGKGYGIIFSFDASSSAYTVVKKFDLTNGGYPSGSLIQAADGKLYGMTQQGGIFNYGVIFSFDPTTSIYLVLHSFNLTNGRNPNGSLLQVSDGKLYGLTVNGGTSDQGVLFLFDPTSSSYTVEKNFNNTDGINPFGSLIQVSDGKLYGMTRGGGSSNYGVIFSFNPSSSSYTVLKNFDQTNGANPFNSLMQAFNGKLYAMTSGGGSSDAGVIFSFDPSNSEYLVLKHFNNSDGGKPYGSLIQISNGTLYGMTLQGGTSNNGIIFSFDPTSSYYNVIHNFDLTNGAGPYFNDVQLNTDGKLYGMTHGGGVHRWGVIFSFDLLTNQYNKLVDIGENHGFYPQGTLCRAFDGKFYGITSVGGSLGYGVIFSFDLATSTYSVVKNFDLANGSNPTGSLIRASDGKLYGMTRFGGASNAGVIFSFDPSTSTYSVLKNFNNTTGASPFGALMQASNGKFYGLTYRGGSLGAGVIFSFDPITFEYAVLKNFQLNDGSYPYGSLIQASNGKFYGMTNQGGSTYQVNYNDPFNIIQSPGYGVIFSFNPVNSDYEVVRNFDLADGGNPYGSLVKASNGKLYGLTNQGGTTNDGVMFSFDPASAVYKVEKYFNNADGSQPYGSLIQASDDKLYGMTRFGGALFAGVIFSFNPATNDYTKKDFDKANGAYPQFSDLLEIKTEQLLSCVADTALNAPENSCSAIVSNIDPKITPAGSAVTYTLIGATSGNGTGTASGLTFNVGTTVVTYTLTDEPSKTCSFTVTVNPTSAFYRDADIDGYGNAAEKIYACTKPSGYVADGTDCNDNDASVHLVKTYYRDADSDGFGDASSSISLCQLTPPSGYVTNNSDCNDNQRTYQDSDGDGYGRPIFVACGGVTDNTDCDDNNPAIHAPVTFYRDADNDGYGKSFDIISRCSLIPPAGYVANGTDCDDSKATTHPGATEICNNGIDDNCNGQIDENCCTISVSIGPDIRSYFGYTPEQCKSITVVITNGTPPYTYNWSLDRPLLFNVITPSGDESITGTNTSTVTVCLLDTANLCVTVTDANGCIFTDCAMVFAEDVRCFSGNGGAQKVRLCHAGSITCVNQNIVSQHLSHGDYLGYCITQAAIITNANLEASNEKIINNPAFLIYPNPNAGDFTASIKLTDFESNNGEMQIINVSGQIIKRVSVNNQSIINVSLDKSGMYLVKLILGNRVMTKKIVVIR